MNYSEQIIMNMIRDRFPDGVDVIQVDPMHGFFHDVDKFEVTEEIAEIPEGQTAPDIPVGYSHTSFPLVELEPETGIYAGMSPVTRSVYVYVDVRQFMELL